MGSKGRREGGGEGVLLPSGCQHGGASLCEALCAQSRVRSLLLPCEASRRERLCARRHKGSVVLICVRPGARRSS
eukprot:11033141-Prorocentrum_lima.AAC.1